MANVSLSHGAMEDLTEFEFAGMFEPSLAGEMRLERISAACRNTHWPSLAVGSRKRVVQ